jgi:hypothetical protein
MRVEEHVFLQHPVRYNTFDSLKTNSPIRDSREAWMHPYQIPNIVSARPVSISRPPDGSSTGIIYAMEQRNRVYAASDARFLIIEL